MISKIKSAIKSLFRRTVNAIKWSTKTMATGSLFVMGAAIPILAVSLIATVAQGPEGQKTETKTKLSGEQSMGREYPIIRLMNKGRTYCSGFVVDKRFILTAAHCLNRMNFMDSLTEIEIGNREGKAISKGHAIAMDKRLDWGVIEGDFSMFAKLKVEVQSDLFFQPGTAFIS